MYPQIMYTSYFLIVTEFQIQPINGIFVFSWKYKHDQFGMIIEQLLNCNDTLQNLAPDINN